jgi:tetratricopeptide (TPR) repeat protein
MTRSELRKLPVDPTVAEAEKKALNEFFAQMDSNDSSKSASRNNIFEETRAKTDPQVDEARKRHMAENAKNKGNECMKTKEYNEAIEHYQKAISLDPTHHVVFGNLAQAYLNLKSMPILPKRVQRCYSGLQQGTGF